MEVRKVSGSKSKTTVTDKFTMAVSRYVDTKTAKTSERLINLCIPKDDARIRLIVDGKFIGDVSSKEIKSLLVSAEHIDAESIDVAVANIDKASISNIVGNVSINNLDANELNAESIYTPSLESPEIISESITTGDVASDTINAEQIEAEQIKADHIGVDSMWVDTINGIDYTDRSERNEKRLRSLENVVEDISFKLSNILSKLSKIEDRQSNQDKSTVSLMAKIGDVSAKLSHVEEIANEKPKILTNEKIIEKTNTVHNNFELAIRDYSEVESMARTGATTLGIDKMGRVVYTCKGKVRVIKGEQI